MSQTRLYIVTAAQAAPRLVEATNPATALRHVARSLYSVAVASPKEVAALMAKGVTVETAETLQVAGEAT